MAIAAGYDHSLALRSDGSIVGWGDDDNGQASPPSGNDFVAIAAGGGHSLALREEQNDCNGNGSGCRGELNGDRQVDLEDLQVMAGILLEAQSPFIVPAEVAQCGDFNADGQLDLDDLQELAGILLGAGPGAPGFIVPCSEPPGPM